jgi:putative ABC transport system permease protein
VPGVTQAAGVTTLPLGGSLDSYGLHIVGQELPNPEAAPSAHRFVVTPGFFQTLAIPAVRGRLLNADDRQNAPPVAVVSETLARELFRNADAIGRQVRLGGADSPARTIVGIARDIKHVGLDVPGGYQVYVPHAQWAWAETLLTLVARTDGDVAAAGAAIRDIVRERDPAQPVTDIRPYADIVRDLTSARRLAATLLAGFAGTATLLAAIGLYGALGVVVGQRTQEIGLRLALGADARRIGALLMAQGLRPALVGLAAGLAIVALAGGVLRSLLYDIEPVDFATLGVAALALAACAAIASAIPAWRATRVNPVSALRAP